jgi:nitrous oxide reductase accessory protein NosL
MMTPRRSFVLAVAASFAAVACQRDGRARCATCGMPIDPASPWRADLVTDGAPVAFDTPRCALLAWRTGRVAARALRVQEFYERAWRDAGELRFVAGSDVVGPMGADLVPVDPARTTKFLSDHHGARAYELSSVTSDVLGSL